MNDKKLGLILFFSFVYSCFVVGCQSYVNNSSFNNQEESMPNSLIKKEGVLYIRSEYTQNQMGLSLIKGGGEFDELTTTYEWWIDAQNPDRIRRVTTEWLQDGGHIVAADGADGNGNWWEVDWARGITTTIFHTGKPPFDFPVITDVPTLFTRGAEGVLQEVESANAQLIRQITQEPYGVLGVIRQTNSINGQLITSTVALTPPHIIVSRIVTDVTGQPFESLVITHWQWLDVTDLPATFWLSLPEEVKWGP